MSAKVIQALANLTQVSSLLPTSAQKPPNSLQLNSSGSSNNGWIASSLTILANAFLETPPPENPQNLTNNTSSTAALPVATLSSTTGPLITPSTSPGSKEVNTTQTQTVTARKPTAKRSRVDDHPAFHRVYNQERALDQLATALVNGSVVLEGPSGSGKTSLVGELKQCILQGKVPSLADYEIHGVSVREIVQEEGGFQAHLDNFWSGGAQARFKHLYEQAQSLGKKLIFFFDEVQDLLNSHTDIFTVYKEELADGRIKLILATTESYIINEVRRRPGMERRLQKVELKEKTKKETKELIDAIITTIGRSSTSHPFTYEPSFSSALVELSKEVYPSKIYPDCSVSLFKSVLAYYHNQNASSKFSSSESSSAPIESLNADAVIKYVAYINEVSPKQLKMRVESVSKEQEFQKSFQLTYLPEMKGPASSPPFIGREAARFQLFLKDHRGGRLFFQGPSNYLVQDVVAEATKARYKMYRCDMPLLLEAVHNDDRAAILVDTLQGLWNAGEQLLLFLSGCQHEWLTLQKAVSSAKAPAPVSREGSTALTRMTRVIENGLSKILEEKPDPSDNNTSKKNTLPSSSKPPSIPKAVEILLNFVEKQPHVKGVIAFIDPEPQPMAGGDENLFQLSPSFDDNIQWLLSKASTQGSGALQRDKIRPMVVGIVHTLCDLQQDSLSAFDLAAKAVEKLDFANCGAQEISQAIFDTFRGRYPLQRVEEAWKRNSEQITHDLFKQVRPSLSASLDMQLKARIDQWSKKPNTAPLMIPESSYFRAEWLASEIAGVFKIPFHRLDALLLSKIPPSLRRSFVLDKIPRKEREVPGWILMTEPLDDEALCNLLIKEGYRIISLHPPLTNSSKEETPPTTSEEPSLIETVQQFVPRPLAQFLPSASSTNHPTSKQSIDKISAEITAQELPKILTFHADGVKKEFQPQIVKLYQLLCSKGQLLDVVISNLKLDMERLKGFKNDEEVFNFWADHYLLNLKMGRLELKYHVNPSKTPLLYRGWRLFTDPAFNGVDFLIQKVASYIPIWSWPSLISVMLVHFVKQRFTGSRSTPA